jgi:phosphatidate cytidylyltransferase
MLLKRIITAIVLLAILAVDLSLENPWPLLVFFSMMLGVTLHEWLRLTLPTHWRWLSSAAGAVLAAATLIQAYVWIQTQSADLTLLHAALIISGLTWLLAIPVRLMSARITHQPVCLWWSLFAPICLYGTWGVLALLWLHSGAWYLLSLLVLVWIADIFAYFGGRRFGKNKLAPQISPGKTREGAFIGLCGVVIWLAVSALYENTYASELKAAWGWPGLILAALLLGLLAIVGDLFESYLKRQADVKDSSRLLPGHGGVFDRIDAVVAVVPVAYLLVTDFWYP